jgi:hypothetical protein
MLANHHAPASDDSPQGDSDGGDSDYDVILTALMDSARGRSFLEEHARRSRITETATLLTAIGRIETLLTSRSNEPAEPHSIPGCGEPSAITSTAMSRTGEALDLDVFDAAPAGNENNLIEARDHGVIVPEQTLDVEIMSLEVTPLRVSAVEFLGPDSPAAENDEAEPTATESQSETAQRRAHDPFADIRALSDEEKIALFA